MQSLIFVPIVASFNSNKCSKNLDQIQAHKPCIIKRRNIPQFLENFGLIIINLSDKQIKIYNLNGSGTRKTVLTRNKV